MTTTATPEERTASRRVPVQYVCNGRVMPENQNRLSSVAYQYTRGIVDGEARISSAALLDRLVDLGVADPKQPGWKQELPNGVVVECLTPGEKPSVAPPAAPKAKKAAKAAKKATPAKTTAPVKKQTPGAKARAKAKAEPELKAAGNG